MNKNIQMKKKEGETWDNLFPITIEENVFDNKGINWNIKVGKINDDIDQINVNNKILKSDIGSNKVKINNNEGNKRLKIIGHRGVGFTAPENTIPSFEMAGRLGLWATEGDFFVTTDGRWVSHHDRSVDRMTNGTGNIDEMTFSQVKNLMINNGSNIGFYDNLKIPTLEDFLVICNRYSMIPVIEVKGSPSSAHLKKMLDTVESYGLLTKTIFSFLSKVNAKNMSALNNDVSIEYGPYPYSDSDIDFIKTFKNGILTLEFNDLTDAVLKKCALNNIKVSAWTINTGKALQKVEGTIVEQIYTDVFI